MSTALRLLLVEDSVADAALLLRQLRQDGYVPLHERVDTPEAMSAALDHGSWDLIIADYTMPGFGAPAALRLLQARGLDLPFIIVSGTIQKEVAVQMMRTGAKDFIIKDDPIRLLPAIARELHEATERRARRAAEEALRSSEESFRLLFAANPQPMWVYDQYTLAFLEVNDAAIAHYGYSHEEFHAMRITDILPAEEAPRLLANRQQPRPPTDQQEQLHHRLKSGQLIDVEIRSHTLTFAGRQAELVVAHDITERARAQRESEQARIAAEELAQLRSDFVAAVSHELRTPLTAIVGYGELLLSRWHKFTVARKREQIGKIVAAAYRQQRLVEDLLLLSHRDYGAMATQCQSILLAPLVQQAVAEVWEHYANQQIDLAGPADLLVLADPPRATQVLVNLLDNAAKYSVEGSPIRVSWGMDGALAVVRVQDFGSGLPDEGRERLFTRFGRVPGSKMRAGRVGTGLGLYLSRQFAEAMGGDLELETTGPTGSTFRLRIPVA